MKNNKKRNDKKFNEDFFEKVENEEKENEVDVLLEVPKLNKEFKEE